ncbi:MAG: hypothetical protein FJY55_09470, partial [Betaproteobacteria bacterium]|nr:hypothetical protein [Betaproteobacteria bacterium]
MTLVGTRFEILANYERRRLGMPELPLAIVPYPMGGVATEEAQRRAVAALDQVVNGLTVQPMVSPQAAKAKVDAGYDTTV